jgi:hypothetical protein
MTSVLEILNIDNSSKLSRQFLICDSCFWAATAITTRRHNVMTCAQCDAVLSCIPLADNESFTFTYDNKRGVELDFAAAR